MHGMDARRPQELAARWSAVMMSNYRTPPVALATRRGRHGLGRRRPRVHRPARRHRDDDPGPRAPEGRRGDHRAGARSSATSPTSRCTSPGVLLAERLLELAGRPGRVFFCNSGAEANEAAFKISRLTGRPEVITAEGAFHGRTMGALALTGQPSKAAAFAPLPGGVRYVPYGDADALAGAVAEQTAMVLLEPMLGEGGVLPAPAGYLAAAAAAAGRRRRAVRRRRGADRHRPHRRTGSCTRPTALAARRHHAGQGAGRRAADGRDARLRRRRPT